MPFVNSSELVSGWNGTQDTVDVETGGIFITSVGRPLRCPIRASAVVLTHIVKTATANNEPSAKAPNCKDLFFMSFSFPFPAPLLTR